MVARKRATTRGIVEHVRADGRRTWEARVTDAAGARHSRSFASETAAVEWRDEYLRKRRRGGQGDLSGERILVRDWARSWLDARRGERGLRPSTLSRDEAYLANHVVPALGAMKLGDVRREHVVAVKRAMTSTHAPATTAKVLQLVAGLLGAAVDAGHIATNPATGVRAPARPDDEQRFLTSDEVRRLEAATPDWWALTVPLLVDTGLRVGELAALTVDSITVDVKREDRAMTVSLAEVLESDGVEGGTVRVRGTASEVAKRVSGATSYRTTGATKTRAGRRLVPTLSATTARRLASARVAPRGGGRRPGRTGTHAALPAPHRGVPARSAHQTSIAAVHDRSGDQIRSVDGFLASSAPR